MTNICNIELRKNFIHKFHYIKIRFLCKDHSILLVSNIFGSFFLNHFWFQFYEIMSSWYLCHHKKIHGSRFGNNNHVNFFFHKLVWSRHGCHSYIHIIWTLMSCPLFKHECHMHVHYCLHMDIMCLFMFFTHESHTQLPCLNNAWHSSLNDTNPWNNKFCTDLEQTHEAYKFVMMYVDPFHNNT